MTLLSTLTINFELLEVKNPVKRRCRQTRCDKITKWRKDLMIGQNSYHRRVRFLELKIFLDDLIGNKG